MYAIRSYYEAIIIKAFEAPNNVPINNPAMISRITSYNVCYTKLLRFIHLMILTICPDGISGMEISMIDKKKTIERLQNHVRTLTQTIGERSVFLPHNLEKTRAYIEKFYQDIDVPVRCEPYRYRNFTVSNIVAQIRNNFV